MRKRLAVLIGALVVGCLPTFLLAQPAQAHPFAYSYVQYVSNGTPRVINVKCHANAQWRALIMGMHSRQVCAQDGWVSQIWVDSDVSLRARPIGGSTVANWGAGYHGAMPPGYWDVWVVKVAGS
jgi:hypothetical protein